MIPQRKNIFSDDVTFRAKSEALDWKKIASIDIDNLIKESDTSQLSSELIRSVIFCKAESEFDHGRIDSGFIKVFRISQLISECLLTSHERCAERLTALQEKNNESENEKGKLLEENLRLKETLLGMKKQLKKVKEMLASSQNEILGQNSDEYDQCPYCTKKFMTSGYLLAHIQRRHQGLPVNPLHPSLPPGGTAAMLYQQQQLLQNQTLQNSTIPLQTQSPGSVESQGLYKSLGIGIQQQSFPIVPPTPTSSLFYGMNQPTPCPQNASISGSVLSLSQLPPTTPSQGNNEEDATSNVCTKRESSTQTAIIETADKEKVGEDSPPEVPHTSHAIKQSTSDSKPATLDQINIRRDAEVQVTLLAPFPVNNDGDREDGEMNVSTPFVTAYSNLGDMHEMEQFKAKERERLYLEQSHNYQQFANHHHQMQQQSVFPVASTPSPQFSQGNQIYQETLAAPLPGDRSFMKNHASPGQVDSGYIQKADSFTQTALIPQDPMKKRFIFDNDVQKIVQVLPEDFEDEEDSRESKSRKANINLVRARTILELEKNMTDIGLNSKERGNILQHIISQQSLSDQIPPSFVSSGRGIDNTEGKEQLSDDNSNRLSDSEITHANQCEQSENTNTFVHKYQQPQIRNSPLKHPTVRTVTPVKIIRFDEDLEEEEEESVNNSETFNVATYRKSSGDGGQYEGMKQAYRDQQHRHSPKKEQKNRHRPNLERKVRSPQHPRPNSQQRFPEDHQLTGSGRSSPTDGEESDKHTSDGESENPPKFKRHDGIIQVQSRHPNHPVKSDPNGKSLFKQKQEPIKVNYFKENGAHKSGEASSHMNDEENSESSSNSSPFSVGPDHEENDRKKEDLHVSDRHRFVSGDKDNEESREHTLDDISDYTLSDSEELAQRNSNGDEESELKTNKRLSHSHGKLALEHALEPIKRTRFKFDKEVGKIVEVSPDEIDEEEEEEDEDEEDSKNDGKSKQSQMDLVRAKTIMELERGMTDIGLNPESTALGVEEMSRALKHLKIQRASSDYAQSDQFDEERNAAKSFAKFAASKSTVEGKMEEITSRNDTKPQAGSIVKIFSAVKQSGRNFKTKMKKKFQRNQPSLHGTSGKDGGRLGRRSSDKGELISPRQSKQRRLEEDQDVSPKGKPNLQQTEYFNPAESLTQHRFQVRNTESESSP